MNIEGEKGRKDYRWAGGHNRPDDPTQLIYTLDEKPSDSLDMSKPALEQLSLLQILEAPYGDDQVVVLALVLQTVNGMDGCFLCRGIAQVPVHGNHSEAGWEKRELAII